ncbi:signal peptide peptidase SppA [Candidatus Woesearchaeota archaeon]|nr:signal peptide peptidase SppA [Candidatus Woesearchaeota archaeon]
MKTDKTAKQEERSPWRTMLWVIAVLTVIAWLVSGSLSFFTDDSRENGNVALIPVKGVILGDGQMLFEQDIASPSEIIGFLEDAAQDPGIEAIVLEINSPGGSAVASEEIANAVKAVNKTTIAWIRDSGTSGAYWIASAADTIVASSMSITGSIGVTASYLQFSGLLKDYNITYEQLYAGKFKEIGSPFRPLGIEERRMFEEQLRELHQEFIRAIAENRKMPADDVEKIATGMFFLGKKAKELGLVDVIGGKGEVRQILEQKLNITVAFVPYEHDASFFDILSRLASSQSFSVGRGIGKSLADTRMSQKLEIRT